MKLSRRAWFGVGGAAALGVALPLYFRNRHGKSLKSLRPSGIPDFRLREGFSAQVVDSTGNAMSDGFVVPGKPDGMASWSEDGKIVLMRNHELTDDKSLSAYPGRAAPQLAHKSNMFGGVTRVVLSEQDNTVIESNLVLTGTANNCAGGTSPWGWLTCEEYTAGDHGFVFLCDRYASKLQPPKRIEAYGRFRHEAVGIDPATHDAYLTEDMADGCLYRFKAEAKDNPFHGQLQALASEKIDVNTLSANDSLEVSWVDVNGWDAAKDDLRVRAVRSGATTFRRGEGVFADVRDGKTHIYFTATTGGRYGKGQVFRLSPSKDGGVLSLVVEAPGGDSLEMPDNVCVSPSGHVFLAEDGSAPNGLAVVCPSGQLLTLAVNTGGGELAGVTFTNDRLFVNLQQRGITAVISGPFSELA